MKACTGWPLKPFDRAHPVRGMFNDPRIAGSSRSFHFGIDISAPNGTPGLRRPPPARCTSRVAARWPWSPVTSRSDTGMSTLPSPIASVSGSTSYSATSRLRGFTSISPSAEAARTETHSGPAHLTPWTRHDNATNHQAILRATDEPPRRRVFGAVDVIADAHQMPPLRSAALGRAYRSHRKRALARAAQQRVVRRWHTPVDFSKACSRRSGLRACTRRVHDRTARQTGPIPLLSRPHVDTRLLPDGGTARGRSLRPPRQQGKGSNCPFTLVNDL